MAPTRMRRPAFVTLACALAAMQAGTREDLAAWAERLALKLWRIARRLREGG